MSTPSTLPLTSSSIPSNSRTAAAGSLPPKNKFVDMKTAKIALCYFTMAIGIVACLGGALVGTAISAHYYFLNSTGLSIFKIFLGIFVPAGYALGVATAFVALVPFTNHLATSILLKSTGFCFAAPFIPLAFGAVVGGTPGFLLASFFFEKAYHLTHDKPPEWDKLLPRCLRLLKKEERRAVEIAPHTPPPSSYSGVPSSHHRSATDFGFQTSSTSSRRRRLPTRTSTRTPDEAHKSL